MQDNFRVNNSSLESVKLKSLDSEDADLVEVHLRYNSANNFSVYKYDKQNNEATPIIEDVDILINPENKSEVILRAPDSQHKL